MSTKIKDNWVRIIDVSDTVLHSKGYTLYKVTSKVFPKNSVEAVTEVIVWKRYNDFKKLHKSLSTIHQNLYLKGAFPPFAKTRYFGRFDPSVIEERRLSALQLLQYAANSFPLFTSQVFVKFFEESHSLDNLLPVETESSHDSLLLQACLQPVPVLDSTTITKNQRDAIQEVATESDTCLGGIWQHHQVPDNISLGSQCTDDDDRTTFTDDDCGLSRHSLDIAEFDPLLQSNQNISELDKSEPNHMKLCNSWLLSALEYCNDSSGEREQECISEFPTPFNELEFSEQNSIQAKEFIISDTKESSFILDLPTPVNDTSNLVSEFDPLVNAELSLNSEHISCSEDNFAATPNTCTNTEPLHNPSYITLAAEYVEAAQVAEENKNYVEAFETYKKAIEVLLQGIQKDKCTDSKHAVRKKVLLYLMRAEELYENKLPKTVDSISKIETSLPLSSLNKINNLEGSMKELKNYKVIGVLDKVLLVLDISRNKTFVAKAIYKSSNARRYNIAHIKSQNVPFMVKLYHAYETNYAIFLILEYAVGGRLWNSVSSYFQHRPLSPIEDGTCLHVESKNKTELCNIYSGKKVFGTENLNLSTLISNQDTDLKPSEHFPSSYIALIKKYADSCNEENKVPLAKCHASPKKIIKHQGSCDSVHEAFELNNEEKELEKSAVSHKNVRNRLLSSTGSLETAISQKACVMEAFNAMDEKLSQVSSKCLLPESCIVLWAAEIVLALEHLHNLGIVWLDFHPDNILLGAEGHILLTYKSVCCNEDFTINDTARDHFFCAPEVGNIFPISSDCDWWSLGAILFELLTGQTLVSCHPTGITRHTTLHFPTDISLAAKDIITKFLQYNPTERLGSGIYGVEEIKSHPFFHSIDWKSLCNIS